MDRHEFTLRVTAMQDKLYRVAFGQLRNTHDCCDAVQEAIFKAWCALPKLRNEDFFETWLIRILINECHNLQRRNKNSIPLESVSEPVRTDESYPVRDSVLALPEKYRLPVILHYMDGYTTDEIARILRIPSGTVRTRLKRAREILKEELASL